MSHAAAVLAYARGFGASAPGYDGEDLVPLPRLVDVNRYLGFVTNRAVPDLEATAALSGLFSASAADGTERTGDRLECVACGDGLPEELQRIAAHGSWSWCRTSWCRTSRTSGRSTSGSCASVAWARSSPAAASIPFCAYNAAGYRAQVRADLAAGTGA